MQEKSRAEKRLAAKLISYWKRLKTEQGLPDIRQFNPKAVEDIWSSCIRLVITEGSANLRVYRYEYMGRDIIEAYGRDLTGQQVTATIRTLPGAGIIKKLDAAIPLREPAMEQGQFINDENKLIKYRSCVLPFGHKGYNISHAIIGLSWKVC